MTRLSFLALFFNLALLATAAPAVKRTGATSNLASKMAYGSLKSAADTMKDMDEMYREDSDEQTPTMSNKDLTLPRTGEQPVPETEPETRSSDEEERKEENGPTPSKPKNKKKPTSDTSSETPAASPPVNNNLLSGLPILGGLLGGGGGGLL